MGGADGGAGGWLELFRMLEIEASDGFRCALPILRLRVTSDLRVTGCGTSVSVFSVGWVERSETHRSAEPSRSSSRLEQSVSQPARGSGVAPNPMRPPGTSRRGDGDAASL